MKMKVLLSVIVFTLYTVSYAQNMKMIDTSMPKKDKKDAVVIEYDSLTNIRPYKDASYYKQFIGQSILFYPRNPNSSESLPKYYANFLTSNEQVVAIDTIWRKKRSNPKPKDYKLKLYYDNFLRDLMRLLSSNLLIRSSWIVLRIQLNVSNPLSTPTALAACASASYSYLRSAVHGKSRLRLLYHFAGGIFGFTWFNNRWPISCSAKNSFTLYFRSCYLLSSNTRKHIYDIFYYSCYLGHYL